MPQSNEVWNVAREDFPVASAIETQLRFLLRYAILAPSPQNSQPWAFAVRDNQVHVFADLARSKPVSDPGRRELYLSVGCTLENLLIAAEHFDLHHSVDYFPQRWQPELVATVVFVSGGKITRVRSGTTLDALLGRHNDAGVFSPAPIPESVRRMLEDCRNESSLALDMTDDYRFRNWIEALTAASDTTDFANPAFRMELAYWTREGAFTVSPRRLLALSRPDSQTVLGETMARQSRAKIESAPLLGLIRSTGDSHLTHVRAGQLFERLWVTATAAGLRVNPMSQTMRRPELRSVVAVLIARPGWVPQHVFRIGYSATPARQHTPRRMVDDVLLR